MSLTQTDDDGSAIAEADLEATADDEAAALDKRDDITELGMLVDKATDKEAEANDEPAALDEAAALDKRDETMELGILVETATDNEAETDEETTLEEDGHGAQAVPVGSLGKPHSDNGASKNCP